MSDKAKVAWEWTTEAVETACGWALFATLAYAALFVDVLGSGSLWSAAKALVADARQPASTVPMAFTRVRVPARAPALTDEERARRASAEDRIFFALDPAESDKTLEVVVAAPRPSETMVDTPADPSAGKSWRRSLKGNLRSFTVYGKGEQSSSASASVAAAASAETAEVRAAPASAYKAGAASQARPGISGRVSRVSAGPADSVRNVR